MMTHLPFDGTSRAELGEGVLAVGRLLGHQRVEDESNEVPIAHEAFVRDGKVVRIRECPAESEER